MSNEMVPVHTLLNTTLPIAIESVRVSGNRRVNNSYFESEIQDALTLSKTLPALEQRLQMATESMHAQDIFEAVDTRVHVKSAREGKFHVDVHITVKEKGVPFLKVDSSIRSSSVITTEVQAALRSPLGFGEVIKFSIGANPASLQPSERYMSLFVPNAASLETESAPIRADMLLTAKIAEEDASFFVGFKQRAETVIGEFRTRDGRHKLELEASHRDEIPLQLTSTDAISSSPAAIAYIANTASSSSKVAGRYSWVAHNSMDSMCSPQTGSFLRGVFELATPLGSAQFFKTELSASTHATTGKNIWGPFPGLTFSLCTSLGLVLPLGGRSDGDGNSDKSGRGGKPKVNLSDRFHLGGPSSLRGFDLYGVGQKAAISAANGNCRTGGVSVGGLSRLSVLGLVSAPIPIASLAKAGAKAFAFVNAGMLGDERLQTIGSNILQLRTSTDAQYKPRISAGFGIAIPVANVARLEATYSIPILSSDVDVLKPFQFGFGMTIN